MSQATSINALQAALERATPALHRAGGEARGRLLGELARDGLAALPRPGAGRTLERWRALACVASHDLSLVKLYEGHTDALAILDEAGFANPHPGQTWGMWAAEPPDARVTFTDAGDGDGRCRLDGLKAWCSGGYHLDRALLTVWSTDGHGPWLASVSLRDPGVSVQDGQWLADGMSSTDTVDVRFDGAVAQLVGPERFYLQRPGFWQGGAGIAACWHGGATAVAQALRQRVHAAKDPGWHLQLALGCIDKAVAANAALLREAAAWIDANPKADAQLIATRTRVNADDVAQGVLRQVGRALGAGPLCRDETLSRMTSDLPIFIRQCHADRDLASLGELVGRLEQSPWLL